MAKHPEQYPSAEDIKKLKEQEKAKRGSGCLPFLFLLFLVALFGFALAGRQPARLEVAAIPPTAILASQTHAPTPTLAPTATATEPPTATATFWLFIETWTPEATHTPLPTYTAEPTHTPLPSATWTPQPTFTPLPTYTAEPTHTPLPLPTETPVAPTRVEPSPAPLPVLVQELDDTRSELYLALLIISALFLVALALVFYSLRTLSPAALAELFARKTRPPGSQPGEPPEGTVPAGITPDGDIVPLSPTAVALPPPSWAPVRESVSPVTNTGDTGVTTGITGDAPAETITLTVQPEERGDEATMREICKVWNNLEEPSLNKVTEAFFRGAKNPARLAVIRRAIKWGKGQGIVKNRDGTWPANQAMTTNGQPKRDQPVPRRRGIRQRPPRPSGVRRIVQ